MLTEAPVLQSINQAREIFAKQITGILNKRREPYSWIGKTNSHSRKWTVDDSRPGRTDATKKADSRMFLEAILHWIWSIFWFWVTSREKVARTFPIHFFEPISYLLMTKTPLHSGDRVLISILIWSGRTSPPHYSTVAFYLLIMVIFSPSYKTRATFTCSCRSRFAWFYGRRSEKPLFQASHLLDQVSEVERLPRSGGLSGHLIHAGMPNDFLFITRKGNGI